MDQRIFICSLLVIYPGEATFVNLLVDRYVQKGKDVKLNCSSDKLPIGKTVEFITDSRSIGNVRSHKGICFNTLFSQKCNKNTCQCHKNEKSYAMFYRLNHPSENLTFLCKMKFSDNTVVYSNIETPRIYTPRQILTSGLTMSLTCLARKTSEDVIVRWACGYIRQNGPVMINSTSVWSKLQLKVDSAFNNKPCNCTVLSTRTNFSVTESVTLKIEKSPILTLKEEFCCNVTETVALICSVRGDLAIFGFEPWQHSLNGTYIRSLNGLNDKYVSLLLINTCSYQDAGEYTCIVWNKHTGETLVANKTTRLEIADKEEDANYSWLIAGVGLMVLIVVFAAVVTVYRKNSEERQNQVILTQVIFHQLKYCKRETGYWTYDANELKPSTGCRRWGCQVMGCSHFTENTRFNSTAATLTEQVGNSDSDQTSARNQYLQPIHGQEEFHQNTRTSTNNQVQTSQSQVENLYELSVIAVNDNIDHEQSQFQAVDSERVPPYFEIQPGTDNISVTSDGYEKVE
ncbi:unnamed protein product [Mytilus edulis]|uniref:Ig-like domain-containing protein n=1 Tax=Mytilus edulis TaxID=6550 RepID=A0A8S3Q4P7_MYTED|nr:unnamed protein product [Mytilus edulis]